MLLVLAHDRRSVVHFNITENPTGHWTAQQVIEAFPRDTAPRYLLRDRDAIFGEPFQRRVGGMASNKYSPPLGALGKIHTLSV